MVSSTHPHNPEEWGSPSDKQQLPLGGFWASLGFLGKCEAPEPVTGTGTAQPGCSGPTMEGLKEPTAPAFHPLCHGGPQGGIPTGFPWENQG